MYRPRLSHFNPLRPRGRRRPGKALAPRHRNFNPLRPRGRRPAPRWCWAVIANFNPLRPRGRRPTSSSVSTSATNDFNPLRPRGRRRPRCRARCSPAPDFNPLRPRGRRRVRLWADHPARLISIRSARGGGDPSPWSMAVSIANFNPLRPRGRRLIIKMKLKVTNLFQPAPPAGAETRHHRHQLRRHRISTRSARGGGDARP